MSLSRYRFNFFQRQFLSLFIITILLLTTLSYIFTVYAKKNIYQSKYNELVSASRSITKILQKEKDPAALLDAYRKILNESKIRVVVLKRNGDPLYKEQKMFTPAIQNKGFLAALQKHIPDIKNEQMFIVDKNTANPWMVSPRIVRIKELKQAVIVFVVSPIQGIEGAIKQINNTIITTAIIALFIAMLISFFISRNMSRSVQSLQHTVQQIAEGNLTARSSVHRSDELGDLAKDFNSMAVQLETASHKLDQFELRRRQFMLDVSHELRTPLTSIRGIVEGLKNHVIQQPEEQQKYYDIIEKETFRLIRLINELLDMEKIENGLVELHSQNYNAKELISLVTESLEVLLEEKHVRIKIDCDENILIFGDYDRLTQVLLNLIKNSIQFTYHGTITITGWEDELHTYLNISDTGQGMTKEELERIWERFYKSDPSRSKNKGETGLGLSIVKQIITAHHGAIDVTSTAGMGTTFHLSFPKPVVA